VLRDLGAAKHLLGYRCSWWTARAPGLETKMALAGMALEEEGHAKVLESFASDALGAPAANRHESVGWQRWPAVSDADLATARAETWPDALARQAALDAACTRVLERLARSGLPGLAQRAAKMVQEERFHTLFARDALAALGARRDDAATGQARRLLEAVSPALATLVAEGLLLADSPQQT
jgi:ring-1,2-phenylacetyl-CoA epoxidase subunit PaaA/ring-1,2-phenylacetyl-CoA epoxidase subunit PaaC